MIVRVNWLAWKNHPIAEGGPVDMYHVYQCDNYMVETMNRCVVSEGAPDAPAKINLFVNRSDGSQNTLALSNGDVAYVMNDEGKTIDIIRTL